MPVKITHRIFLISMLCVATSISSNAQVTITGKVTDAVTGASLSGAYVLCNSSGNIVYTDSAGHYQITIEQRDTLEYHYVGYYIEKYKVPKRLTNITHPIQLLPKRNRLKMVNVKGLSKYAQDSTERRHDFQYFLDLPTPQFLDTHTPPDHGLGFVFHPFTYFSKEARRKRKFQKRYKQHEKEDYIDSRYTPQIVSKVTGLSGDSLRIFMLKFRPSYKFTRYSEELEFKSWILKHYKNWR